MKTDQKTYHIYKKCPKFLLFNEAQAKSTK